jgi:hypothetical protein
MHCYAIHVDVHAQTQQLLSPLSHNIGIVGDCPVKFIWTKDGLRSTATIARCAVPPSISGLLIGIIMLWPRGLWSRARRRIRWWPIAAT